MTEILNAADAASEAVVAGPTETNGEAGDLVETATRASDLLESTEPEVLLEAVGLEMLPDGSEPDSIPEAIVEGEPAAVEHLERLLRLGNLADQADKAEIDDVIGVLRAAGESKSGRGSEPSAGEEATGREQPDGDGSLEDRLRSTMRETVTEFGDEVTQIQQRLEEVTAGDGEASRDEAGSADEGDEAETADEEPSDETGDEQGDGLFDRLGSDGRRSSRGVVRHSTTAPSPSDRTDMKALARFSTMPDRDD
ncbi:hypothetical protein SAMN05443661_10837 [Natronobacterium gregoryi]|uniref:Uncharacterized protein n=2 Tax=Natronobacterium gregoryi TaxID=44930 RepID=L0AD66_NATGS|nr:hypothetical protein Natgr_0533 [Natronobacterium gregoryi SP2]SFI87841.1 hypothetical protein SAMN05443661_10837 [Natronobacterium gregoryi]